MKKIIIGLIVFNIIFILVGGGIFLYIKHLKDTPIEFTFDDKYELSQEDAFLLNKPTVIRIVTTYNGVITVPHFSINLHDFTIKFDENNETVDVPLENERVVGTGHIVGKDGFILTNAHVVSNDIFKKEIANKIFMRVFEATVWDFMATSTEEEINKFDEYIENMREDGDSEKTDKIEEMMDSLLQKMGMNMKKEVVVLNPSISNNNIKDEVKNGFRATIVSINDNYDKDNRDVALIKIDQTNLPTVSYDNETELVVGDKVHVFSFPASATFGENDFTESTLTNGLVSAFKKSQDESFDIIQTDAKISQGSSGGPLFMDAGDVVGMITYQTGEEGQETGDNFAFAIPADIVQNSIEKYHVNKNIDIPNDLFEDGCMQTMKEGKQLYDNKHCKQAIEKFNYTNSLNESFGVGDFSKKYTKKCQDIIDNGESIDTMWDVKQQELSKIDRNLLLLIGIGIIVGIVLIIVITTLFIRIKNNKVAINKGTQKTKQIKESSKTKSSNVKDKK
jgi:S1-C subfamily serine protease